MLDWKDYRGAGGRRRPWATMLAAAALAAIALAPLAEAHHPGSHARRLPGGAVKLDAVINVSDGCTAILSIAPGTPQGATPPRNAAPVVITLAVTPGACIQVVRSLRETRELQIATGLGLLHLFVVDSKGRVVSTERVRID